MPKIWDVAVLGSGIVGTSAAFHCARLGYNTVKIDQFDFAHDKGSSHGRSRITRIAHVDPAYVPIVRDTHRQIAELEAKRGKQLWINNGIIWIGGKSKMEKLYSSCTATGCEMQMMNAKEIQTRFPLYQYDDSWHGVFDMTGGIALTDRWMGVYHDEFLLASGTFRGNTEVTGIEKGGDGGVVSLNTSQGEIKAARLIIAAGSWVNKLMPELGVNGQPLLMNVCYWRPKDSDKDAHVMDPVNMPVSVIYDKDDSDREYFAVPPVDHQGAIKFIDNSGGDPFPAGGLPEKNDEIFIRRARDHVTNHMPAMHPEPVVVERCKYTMSPDGSYVIDFVNGHKNIVLCSMMSGTGFKMSPGLGRGLAHMVTGREMPFDLSSFSARRFAGNQ